MGPYLFLEYSMSYLIIQGLLYAQYTRPFHCTLSVSDSVILSIDRFSLCAMWDRMIRKVVEMIEVPDL